MKNRLNKSFMNKSIIIAIVTFLWMAVACTNQEEQLRHRAAELCQHLPHPDSLEQSKDYLTPDFYTILDTLFHLPNHEAMDHEWLHYFVTNNGGAMTNCEVLSVEQSDPSHALATIRVRQTWEDGSFDEENDMEEHLLSMEKVNGQWLLSDFDHHRQDCIRHIEINRKEQNLRDAINNYLVREKGKLYRQGDVCIPTLLMVATEEIDSTQARVWCETHLYWYDIVGDTLKAISGGTHSGCMTIQQKNDKFLVTNFEQTTDGAGNEARAKRIFAQHYDIYQNIHSHHDVAEAVRKEQLCEYIQRHHRSIRYYQDYGQEAVEL